MDEVDFVESSDINEEFVRKAELKLQRLTNIEGAGHYDIYMTNIKKDKNGNPVILGCDHTKKIFPHNVCYWENIPISNSCVIGSDKRGPYDVQAFRKAAFLIKRQQEMVKVYPNYKNFTTKDLGGYNILFHCLVQGPNGIHPTINNGIKDLTDYSVTLIEDNPDKLDIELLKSFNVEHGNLDDFKKKVKNK